jgi:hypothetical protein
MDEYGLRQTDIWHYADYYAGQHKLAVPARGEVTLSAFLSGNGLNETNYDWLSNAIKAIKAVKGDIPKAADIRAMSEKPVAAIKVVAEDENDKPPPQVPKVPTLAFDAMRMIYDTEKDHDAIMALVQDIAKLELKTR